MSDSSETVQATLGGGEDDETPDDLGDPGYVDHNLIVDEAVEGRRYQTELADRVGAESSLVGLPTGTGKTIVSLLVTAERLAEVGGTSVFLAPTKPLVEQQAEFYTEVLDIADEQIRVFTGDIRPDDREELWNDGLSVVMATPQVIENDLIAGRISFEDVTHLTFDECHRATGDYSYVYIAEKYWREAENPLATGLSASPGSNEEEILNICKNLGVTNVEVVTEDDPLLEPYTHDVEVEDQFVDIDDEILEIRNSLQSLYKEHLKFLKKHEYVESASKTLPMYKLQKAVGRIRSDMGGEDSTPYTAMSIYTEASKLAHAIGVIETQGVGPFEKYWERQEAEAREEDSSKAVKKLLKRPEVEEARRKAAEYDKTHPKKQLLRGYVVETVMEDGQCIVFTNSRDNVAALVDFLNDHGPLTAHRFVGQNNDDGMGLSQKEQKEVINQFRAGEFDVLVSTSIAEEGLDIPQVDLVLFYEPVGSAIRDIQRKGRTGRASDGRVVVLIGRDTRDMGAYFKAKSNSEKMESDMADLAEMKDELNEELGSSQENLKTFTATDGHDDTDEATADVDVDVDAQVDAASGSVADETDDESGADDVDAPQVDDEDDVVIIADQRETKSSVVRTLDRMPDVEVRVETLEVGDYIVGDFAVERKDTADFISTLTGGERSIFEQVGDAKRHYGNAGVIVEGARSDLYEANVHPNAIRGTLASLASDFGLSVMHTVDEEDTAWQLAALAKREQKDETRDVSAHGKKQTSTITDQQEYIVSSVEDIGPQKARALLTHFGSVKAIFDADIDALTEVDGIGEKTAERTHHILRADYDPADG